MKITIEDGDKKLEITNPNLSFDQVNRDFAEALPVVFLTISALGAKEYTADDQLAAWKAGKAALETQLADARAVIDEQNAVLSQVRQLLVNAGVHNALPRFKSIAAALADLDLDPGEPFLSREEVYGLACDIHEKTIEIRKALARGMCGECLRLNEEIHDLANTLCDRA